VLRAVTAPVSGAWAFIITLALFVAAGWYGCSKLAVFGARDDAPRWNAAGWRGSAVNDRGEMFPVGTSTRAVGPVVIAVNDSSGVSVADEALGLRGPESSLVLVHVVSVDVGRWMRFGGEPLPEQMWRTAGEAAMISVVDHATGEVDSVTLDVRPHGARATRWGERREIARAIVEAAREHQASVLVVGRSERGTLSRPSISELVRRWASFPVCGVERTAESR
jgi:hypothetical protein